MILFFSNFKDPSNNEDLATSFPMFAIVFQRESVTFHWTNVPRDGHAKRTRHAFPWTGRRYYYSVGSEDSRTVGQSAYDRNSWSRLRPGLRFSPAARMPPSPRESTRNLRSRRRTEGSTTRGVFTRGQIELFTVASDANETVRCSSPE